MPSRSPKTTPGEDRKAEESELDRALADSFPASDPIAMVTPDSGSGAPPRGRRRKPAKTAADKA